MSNDMAVGTAPETALVGPIHALFPLFYPRNPPSLIKGHSFLEYGGRWLAKKGHVIRDDGLRRVITLFSSFHGLSVSFPTPFSLTWVCTLHAIVENGD